MFIFIIILGQFKLIRIRSDFRGLREGSVELAPPPLRAARARMRINKRQIMDVRCDIG